MQTRQLIVLATFFWSTSAGAQIRSEKTAQTASVDSDAVAKDVAAGRRATEAPKPLRIGALGGLGFPRPLVLEGMVRFRDVLGLGVEYGASPTISISGVDADFWSLSGDLRLFPLQGPFFVGLRAGYQHIGASTTITIAPLGSVAESATLDTYFVNPRIGFLWTLGPGITIATEAGVQVALSSNLASTVPAGVLARSPDATRALNTLGGALPTVDLLRIGLLF